MEHIEHKDTMVDDELSFEDLGPEEEPARPADPEEEPNTIISLQDLITAGKLRGFVTEGEILQLVPNPETDVDKLEEIQQALQTAGITTRDEIIAGGSDVEGVFDEEVDFE